MFTSFFRGFMEVLNLQLKRIKDLRFQLILGNFHKKLLIPINLVSSKSYF